VSLLLEALKKAEAAKRRDDGNGDAAGADVAAPQSAAPPAAPPTPRITPAHELELIDDEIAQAARFAGLDVPEPTPSPPPAPASSGAEAARLLFDAKRPAPRSVSPLSWLIGAAAVLLLGVGAWVVWQIQSLERGTALAPRAPPTRPGAIAAPAAMPATAPLAAASAPAHADSTPLQPPSSAAASADGLTQSASPRAGHEPVAVSSRYLSGQLRAASEAPMPADTAHPPSAPPASPIRITRNPPRIPQGVADGYTAFNAGEFDRARLAYESALRADPRNPDALHGLAALAQLRGDDTMARELMRRIAEVDPSDTGARIALNEGSDPVTQEARLLDLEAARPQSATVALALGNLYASQARWREAQQAYFNAYSRAPEQPDHAYNLAVSLDQLRQPRLALRYYREALALRNRHVAAFDAQQVSARIAALEIADGR
jgi:tetratricopeptide (TPR) repeat protein